MLFLLFLLFVYISSGVASFFSLVHQIHIVLVWERAAVVIFFLIRNLFMLGVHPIKNKIGTCCYSCCLFGLVLVLL